MLIGAEKIEQIVKNVLFLNEEPLDIEIRKRIYEEFSDVPDIVINPSLWNKNIN